MSVLAEADLTVGNSYECARNAVLNASNIRKEAIINIIQHPYTGYGDQDTRARTRTHERTHT